MSTGGERHVGKRIRVIREDRQMSRLELGALIGMSEPNVGRIERTGHVSADQQIKIAKALNCEVADFYDPIDAPRPRLKRRYRRPFRPAAADLKYIESASISVGVDKGTYQLVRVGRR